MAGCLRVPRRRQKPADGSCYTSVSRSPGACLLRKLAIDLGGYNAARAHSRLDDFTPDAHYFANLPAQALAA